MFAFAFMYSTKSDPWKSPFQCAGGRDQLLIYIIYKGKTILTFRTFWLWYSPFFSVLVVWSSFFMVTICSFLLPRASLTPKTYIFCCVKLEVGYWKSRETYFQNGCTSLKTPAELYRNCKSKANVTVMRA